MTRLLLKAMQYPRGGSGSLQSPHCFRQGIRRDRQGAGAWSGEQSASASVCLSEEIRFATARVWVAILYFKTLSEIPSCATETGGLQTRTEWKKRC